MWTLLTVFGKWIIRYILNYWFIDDYLKHFIDDFKWKEEDFTVLINSSIVYFKVDNIMKGMNDIVQENIYASYP